MPKYRIIKIEDAGTLRYRVQRRLLFWFVTCGLIENYFRRDGRALLIYRKYDFASLELAELVLERIKNPFKEKYKGNKIIRVFGDVQVGLQILPMGDIFINLSNTKYWNGRLTYEYAENLDQLKRIIDSRTTKIKISIIK